MDAAPSSRALMAGCEPREDSGWRVHQSVRARVGPRLLRVVRGVRATIWLRRSGRPPWFAWCHGVGAAYGWDIWSDPCIFVAICKKRAHARVTRPRGLTAGPRGTHSTRQGHARDTCPRRATQARAHYYITLGHHTHQQVHCTQMSPLLTLPLRGARSSVLKRVCVRSCGVRHKEEARDDEQEPPERRAYP